MLANIAASKSHQNKLSDLCWTIDSMDLDFMEIHGYYLMVPETWVGLLWPGAPSIPRSSSPDIIMQLKKLAGTIWGRWRIFKAKHLQASY